MNAAVPSLGPKTADEILPHAQRQRTSDAGHSPNRWPTRWRAALAWIADTKNQHRRAVVLTAAAERLGRLMGVSPAVLPDLVAFQQECEQHTRDALGAEAYEAARREGGSLTLDQAVAYALDDPT